MKSVHIYRLFLSIIISIAPAAILAGDSNVATHLNTCDYSTYTPNYAVHAAPLHWWRQFPVKVHFTGIGTFKDVDGTVRDLQPIILSGFDQWVRATEGEIHYIITDEKGDADIIITWEQRSGSIKGTDKLANTDLIYNPETGMMLKATIAFYLWDKMSPSQVYEGLKKTAAHEFAHALGMRAHSDDPNDVMFGSYNPNKFSPLTERDLNTMKTQYCRLFK